MKKTILILIALITMLNVNGKLDSGHYFPDFYVANEDGITIYYHIVDETTKTVGVCNNYQKKIVYRSYYGYFADTTCYPANTINIPSTVTYNGSTYTVVQICEDAFYNNKITGVTIPNTVTAIYEDAFWACKNLTSVSIPSSVDTIGLDVFGACSSLTIIDVDINNPKYASDDGVLYDKQYTRLICCPAGRTADVKTKSTTKK